jgi:hypothetical protein
MLRFLCTGLKNRAEPVMQGNQGGEVTTEEPLDGHYVQPIRCLTFLQAALYRQIFPVATDFLNLSRYFLSRFRQSAPGGRVCSKSGR